MRLATHAQGTLPSPAAGLTPELLAQHGMPLERAVGVLQAALPPHAVLVGQNISKDVQWLGLKEGVHFEQVQRGGRRGVGVQRVAGSRSQEAVLACLSLARWSPACERSRGGGLPARPQLGRTIAGPSLSPPAPPSLPACPADDGPDGPVSGVEPAVQVVLCVWPGEGGGWMGAGRGHGEQQRVVSALCGSVGAVPGSTTSRQSGNSIANGCLGCQVGRCGRSTGGGQPTRHLHTFVCRTIWPRSCSTGTPVWADTTRVGAPGGRCSWSCCRLPMGWLHSQPVVRNACCHA